ncbi:putative magnesium transport protein [Rosellinia necatrix]|uniref:Putative magnesium transport protein n=1 Tax=Rosellinia necatrix TaxID=77044 RepID=A0A1W2TXE9_ROSNE|nr:putative magnesium transport protein [Rosellinia necatrix]
MVSNERASIYSHRGRLTSSTDKQEAYNWLKPKHRSSTYASFTQFDNRPATAFDFGDAGYAASCNHGGELLQMSALCERKGLILARGYFELTLESILARSHLTSGGKSTFGLKLLPTVDNKQPSLSLGAMKGRGCFNYRWPVNDYTILKHEDGYTDDNKHLGVEAGTCVFFSYVKDGVVYQVLRIEQGTQSISDPVADICCITLGISEPAGYEYLYQQDIDGTDRSESIGSPEKEHSRFEARLFRHLEPPDVETKQEYEEISLSEIVTRDGVRTYQTTWKPPERSIYSVQGRTETFVAALRLGPISLTSPSSLPKPLSSKELYATLGVDPLSIMATGAMWETLFLWKGQKANSMSELNEVSLVARCMEKILRVDTVPAMLEESSSKHGSIALMSNIFLRAGLDIQSLFWKVQFLIKLLDFLEQYGSSKILELAELSPEQRTYASPTIGPENMGPFLKKKLWYFINDISTSHETAREQIKLITNCIGQIVNYLVTAFIKPRSNVDNVHLAKPSSGSDHSYYYVMITLWYVVKNRPECIRDIARREEFQLNFATWLTANHCERRGALWDSDRLPSDEWLPEKDLTTEICLLRWYHYGSIWALLRWSWNVLNIPDEKKTNVVLEMAKLHNIVRRLVKAANIALAAKTSSKAPYVPGDEIIDRLSFLAGEIDAENINDVIHYKMDGLAIHRIRQREYTKLLNPGKYPADEWGITEGPWEVHALCHHSRLKVAYMDGDHANADTTKKEIERFRQKFCPFLTTEGTILSTWERKYPTQHKGWLRSEVTCVIASTLLDISRDELFGLRIEGDNERAARDPNVELDMSDALSADDADRSSQTSTDTLLSDRSFQNSFSEPNRDLKPVDWIVFRPPHTYYPKESLISLDDTEDYYKRQSTQRWTQFRRLPAKMRDYLEESRNEWTKVLLIDLLRHKWISVIDIFSNSNRDVRVLGKLRAWKERVDCKRGQGSGIKVSKTEAEVWEELGRKPPKDVMDKPYMVIRLPQPTAHQELEDVLSDSLVDKGVQHRLLFINEPAPIQEATNSEKGRERIVNEPTESEEDDTELVGLFTFVLHPEAVDGFANQLQQISRFFCHGNGRWLARITLRSWTLHDNIDNNKELPDSLPKFPRRRFNLAIPKLAKVRGMESLPKSQNIRDDQISMPRGLKTAFSRLNPDASERERHEPKQVSLKVSSIILSANDFGDFSKCTVISDILPPSAMELLGTDLKDLWQTFVHQPQTARCLAFLLILGVLCEEITKGYDEAIDWFVKLLQLDGSFIRDEDRWIKDKDSVAQLKLGLWSLESFHNLKNSLETAVKCVREAKRDMLAQIDQGRTLRSDALQRMCQEYLEGFESRMVALEAVNIRLGRKIDLNSRYKDSMADVLSLRDNRNSFNQNNTIQVLTYMTILYLPAGLTAAIFAIPDAPSVIGNKIGLPWFFGVIFILLTFTIAIAIIMANFSEWWEKAPRREIILHRIESHHAEIDRSMV